MARKSRKNQINISEETKFKVYKTAIYARFSREHQDETIENQIEEVKAYIKSRYIFELKDIYADNGYSGTDFNRPEFERLMEDIRNQKINCIIVRDLSRFAREHIGAEDYLNNIFPFLGVRFIAINDGYDNLNLEPQEYFMISFKNLAHAYFAQETSRKVSIAKRNLQEQGKFVGSKVSFGYKRNPDDKHSLIINEEEAVIVREIFQRVANGETTKKICKSLNIRCDKVCAILKKEIYKGTLVQHRTVTSLYKNEKMRKVPENQQIRIENAVPAIVSSELWEKAKNAVAERERKKHEGIPENPYKDLVFCGKCGMNLKGGFVRSLSDFRFNCTKCRNGVYAKGENINILVRNHLKLPENTEITKDFLNEKFEKIIIFGRENIILYGKDGEQY